MHENERVDFRFAIRYAPITVLPKAVVAESTPISCCNSAPAAISCSIRSVPLNSAAMGAPGLRLSSTWYDVPASSNSASNSSSQPRGMLRYSALFSVQSMILGLS